MLSIKIDDKKPSLKDLAFSLTESIKDTIKGYANTGVIIAEENVINKRIELCTTCPSFQPEHSRCLKCGCFMNVKARLAVSTCPIGKW
jgi:hypothetical protein